MQSANTPRKLPGVAKFVVFIIAVLVMFYLTLPPLNPQSPAFWVFVLQCLIIYVLSNFFGILSEVLAGGRLANIKYYFSSFRSDLKFCILAFAAIIALLIGGNFLGTPVLWADSYYKLLPITDGNFSQDVSQISSKNIPVVDRDSASRLGKRKLGEMSDLVSQFDIMENYTQINYQGVPYRVTPLRYGDTIKWFYNQSKGIPAYITVNMVTQDASLVRLDKGIRYSESEYFFRNIHRHLRFNHPTKIFDKISFEVDDNGVPYWIAPTIDYRVALWSGRDIDGAVLVNAQTGESKFYELGDIPKWVDQVFISELVFEQLIYHGRYKLGFINSIMGQKGVLRPTDGYNYLAINDDVYLYTGLTSVMSDASNVGFVLVNLRTKEAHYYNVPGAEENSAMESAEGKVQNLKYRATFPILLNIHNRPTYFLSLKDDAGLVKMYAFVDVEQYQIVGTGSTVYEALHNYSQMLSTGNVSTGDSGMLGGVQEKDGRIADISSAVVSGNTCYYFILTEDKKIYRASINVSERLPFLRTGDSISFIYKDTGSIGEIQELK